MSNLNNGGLTRVLNYIKTWVNGLLSGKSDTSHTHTKSQITDFPSIPSKTSDLTNDSGYLTSHQSLSNYVTLNSAQTISSNKTFNDRTIFKKGSYIHSFGSGQDVGYIKFATITIDATYQDCTATLVIMNRSYYKPVYVYIKFNGTDNVDPNINFFATDATNNNANDYYLVKSATSTWDLYVYKTAWNTFCVLDFWQSQNNTEHVTFTWKAEFVSSLPSGNIKATFSAYNYNDLSNKPTIPSNTNQLTNGAGYITTDGAAYPRRVGGVTMNFNWSGQGGQPTWLWGGEDGTNMYVYNPANFSVNYANSAGSSSIATRDSGGSWISGRDNAVVKQTRHSTADGYSWNPAVSVKTKNGNWTIGTVGYDRLQFSYDTDADYNAGSNRSIIVELNPESGRIITSGNTGNISISGYQVYVG